VANKLTREQIAEACGFSIGRTSDQQVHQSRSRWTNGACQLIFNGAPTARWEHQWQALFGGEAAVKEVA
jgi:hypothetical protein